MTLLPDTAADLGRARDLVVREWRAANHLDLLDLNAVVRERLLATTTAGWDRHLTIQQTAWAYTDLDTEAQDRVDRVLRNRQAMEANHDLV